eukprot:6179968-Pleurochrysis_carterae.AAC.1
MNDNAGSNAACADQVSRPPASAPRRCHASEYALVHLPFLPLCNLDEYYRSARPACQGAPARSASTRAPGSAAGSTRRACCQRPLCQIQWPRGSRTQTHSRRPPATNTRIKFSSREMRSLRSDVSIRPAAATTQTHLRSRATAQDTTYLLSRPLSHCAPNPSPSK